MKTIHLLSTFFVVIALASPSTSQKLVKDGNQWNIVRSGIFTPNTTSYALRLEGDTLINNVSYKILWQSVDSTYTKWNQTGSYFREDSAGRVYQHRGFSPEILLYDFSLEQGDTFRINDYCSLRILSVDSIRLNNSERRKRLKVQYSTPYYIEEGYWIEGIGDWRAEFYTYAYAYCATDYELGLLCYYENGELLYPENPSGCWVVPVGEIEATAPLKIFPNPVSDILVFQLMNRNEGAVKAALFDNLGVLVEETTLSGPTSYWQLNHLPKGSYYLKIIMKNGRIFTQRLVKQ